MAIEETVPAVSRTLTLHDINISVESSTIRLAFHDGTDYVHVVILPDKFGAAINAIISATSPGQVLRKIEDYVLAQGLATGVRV